jgi:hypothetical protein
MDDHGRLSSGEEDTFAEDRTRRLRRGRLLRFALCITIWALSVIPLARDSIDGREGARIVAVYLVVGALSLGLAAVIRGVYVLVATRRQFWSPSLFLIAAVLAVMGYAVQSAGEEVVPIAGVPVRESNAE